jgi:D-sedoheptulose 7-phosphate isomerase
MDASRTSFHDAIAQQIEASINVKKSLTTMIPAIASVADTMIKALLAGKKLFFFGNGGSAADAQHLAAEFVGRFLRERVPYPALALTVDSSCVTAIANDYSYDDVFARQLEALGAAGDVAVGISTSGNSKNVLKAMAVARTKGISTVALTGATGGALKDQVEVCLCVPTRETPRIQESHILIGHILCDIVEVEVMARSVQKAA